MTPPAKKRPPPPIIPHAGRPSACGGIFGRLLSTRLRISERRAYVRFAAKPRPHLSVPTRKDQRVNGHLPRLAMHLQVERLNAVGELNQWAQPIILRVQLTALRQEHPLVATA